MLTGLSGVNLTLGGVRIGVPLLVGGLIALALFLVLYLLIDRTDFGLALQATAEDRDAAMLVGIRPQRMYAVAWGLGTALVAVAGVILANFFSVYPQAGLSFTVLAYAIVALGGFGSHPGHAAGRAPGRRGAERDRGLPAARLQGRLRLRVLHPDRPVPAPGAIWPLLAPPARAGRAQQVVWVVATLVALLYPIPFERSGQIYYETVGFLVLLNAMLGIGWNIIGGWAGQFDFGPEHLLRDRRLHRRAPVDPLRLERLARPAGRGGRCRWSSAPRSPTRSPGCAATTSRSPPWRCG